MQIWSSSENIQLKNTAIAIGNFDGVHLAHQQLIGATIQAAKERNLTSVIFTFDEHTTKLLSKPVAKRLLTQEEKQERIAALGPDVLYLQACSPAFFSLEAEEFVRDILLRQFGAAYVAAGFNSRFGQGGRGDAAYLKQVGRQYGFAVDVLPEYSLNGRTVSSTNIRACLAEGNILEANAMLGYPYFVRGTVVEGKHLGRTLRFPTVNLLPTADAAPLRRGVYVTETILHGKSYRSVTNVGVNPTVDKGGVKIETHLCGYEGDAYGASIQVSFLAFLRDEKRFSSVDELAAQVQEDIQKAEKYV